MYNRQKLHNYPLTKHFEQLKTNFTQRLGGQNPQRTSVHIEK